MAMTEAASNITLCNQSLGLLGAKVIVLNGTTQNHKYCTTFFDQSRDEILVSHPWNFARKRAFAIQTTNLLFGYDNAFTVPSDCLRILTVADNPAAEFRREGDLILTGEGESPTDYDDDSVEYLAGQYISSDDSGDDLTYLVGTAFTSSSETTDLSSYCTSQGDDYNVLEIEYIYQVTDVSTYPKFLYQCMVYNLAIRLCSPIKQDGKFALNLQSMLYGGPKSYGYLGLARSYDAQEAGGTVIKTQTWLSSRRTGRRRI